MQRIYEKSCVENPNFECRSANDAEETKSPEGPCSVKFEDDFVDRISEFTMEELFDEKHGNTFTETLILADDGKLQHSQYLSYNSSDLEEMWSNLLFDSAELCNTIIQFSS